MKISTILHSGLVVLMMWVGVSTSSAQIVFSEDFQGGIPATWTLIDNDGNIPDPNVAQFTAAWIGADDFTTSGDTVAMSTSWYSPPGQSDDWLITPAITLTANNVLSWEDMAQDANFPDGYNVYISTTTPTIAGLTANPAIYTSTGAPAAWTAQQVDLQAAGYSNQTVYIGFQNNSTDQFILKIDDVVVQVQLANDLAMQGATEEYTIVPLSEVGAIGTSGTITNLGGSAAAGAMMNVNITDFANTNVYSGSSSPAAIPSGNSLNATVPGYLPTVSDLYTIEYTSSMMAVDQNMNNDTSVSFLLVDDSTYARDNGQVAGTIGIGTGTGGELGQLYTLPNVDTLTSVSAYLGNGNAVMNGRPFSLTVYDVVNGVPASVLCTTDTITIDTTTNTLWTIPISGGPFVINVDSIAVVAQETDSNVTVGLTNDIFTLNTTYVLFGANPWAPNEAYNINQSYIIRPNFGDAYTPPPGCTLSIDMISGVDVLCSGGTDGTAMVTASGNQGGLSYSWTGGDTTASISGLSAGTYTVAVTDTAGCLVDTAITITEPAPISLSFQSTDVACNGGTDGSATVSVVSGNQGGIASYSWTSGGTTDTETGLGAGSYDVTVTDSVGCSVTSTVTITEPSALTAVVSGTDVTVFGGSDGTASAAPSGGTSGYTYAWSPGGETTQSITGLTAGTYTVTITDANGCTFVDSVSIADGPDGIYENRAGVDLLAFPNPVDDQLTLSINLAANDDLTVEVVNTLGQVVFNTERDATNALFLQIDTDEWSAGIYHVVVSTSTGKVSHKVTKQ